MKAAEPKAQGDMTGSDAAEQRNTCSLDEGAKWRLALMLLMLAVKSGSVSASVHVTVLLLKASLLAGSVARYRKQTR